MSNIIKFTRSERRKSNPSSITPVELVTSILSPRKVDVKSIMQDVKKTLKAKSLVFRISYKELEHLKGKNVILFPKIKCGFSLDILPSGSISLNGEWKIHSIAINDRTQSIDIVNEIVSKLGDDFHVVKKTKVK